EIVALGDRGFFVRDGWLGASAAQAVREAVLSLANAGGLRPAAMGRGAGRTEDPAERGDQIAWIDPAGGAPALARLAGEFERLRTALNQGAYLGLDRFDLQVACYQGGARYARHRDALSGRPGRRATAIYYANPDWQSADGGALVLHVPPAPVTVAPL